MPVLFSPAVLASVAFRDYGKENAYQGVRLVCGRRASFVSVLVAMKSPTRICLVRHGETDWNAGDRLQGSIDVELNALGREQASAAARRLAGEDFVAIYSSDLARARQTAEIIAASGHSASTSPLLLAEFRERCYGVFEGLTRSEARRLHADDYAAVERRDPQFQPPGGGESLEQLSARVVGALQRVADAHRGESLLIVTHGGVLDVINRFIRGLPFAAARDFHIPNAGINRLTVDGAGWRIECWADTRHLFAEGRDELM
jgi:probable phosphoglycerate mutase